MSNVFQFPETNDNKINAIREDEENEMDWTNKNANPEKIVSLGQEIEVMILDIDPERRRISLGIKQCQENPWKKFMNSHKAGDKIVGIIKSITRTNI